MKSDVTIIGGGPGGTTCAMTLAEYGITSTIVERDEFPRFQIGESMTGECGAIVRELGLEDRMLKDRHPRKYGVRVYGPEAKSSWYVPVMKRTPEGKLSETFTWQVRRSTFDKMMLDEARARGATVVPGRAKGVLRSDSGDVCGVRVQTVDGGMLDLESQVVVDASGYASFLCAAGVTGKKSRARYDKQVAIFAQVTGAIRDEGKTQDDTLIFYRAKNHWAWFIPLDEDVVSVGVVVPADYLATQEKDMRALLLRELHGLNPELTRRLPELNLIDEVRVRSNYSFHIKEFTGRNYVCIGDAHRFIDPVFSFGLYMTMKEARIAGVAVRDFLAGAHRDDTNPFARHQAYCDSALDVVQDFVDAFWDCPFQFALFVHHRYVEDFIDMFAGRVYLEEGQATPAGLKALQGVLAQERSLAGASRMN